MEEELIHRSIVLDTKKRNNNDTIDTLKKEYETLHNEKQEIERVKNTEI
jgi:hypothetical protein